jgi:hypothetical protein
MAPDISLRTMGMQPATTNCCNKRLCYSYEEIQTVATNVWTNVHTIKNGVTFWCSKHDHYSITSNKNKNSINYNIQSLLIWFIIVIL